MIDMALDKKQTRSPGGAGGLLAIVAAFVACSPGNSLVSGAAGSGGTGGGEVGGGGGGGGAGSGGAGGQEEPLPDPAEDGPYAYAELDDSFLVAATGNTVAIHCAHPTSGPSSGPYPVVVFGHGFQLPPSQYGGYVRRLASFGYVALTVDFPAGLFGANHVKNARDLLGGLDWAAQAPELGGQADSTHAGASGHSLGGKVALLAATLDTRIAATITLDPVDSSVSCSPQDCPDVSALMPIAIPTGFVGETLDASGGFQPCAPEADNFYTFYAHTSSPSLLVDVHGANHMSFLDDSASCGITCSFCQTPTLPNATVHDLAQAFVVAFYERHLRGRVAYDTYLTGPEAVARYVDTGLATLEAR